MLFIPVSALSGDNVVERSSNMPWYAGPSILEHLESVELLHDLPLDEARFQVQYVIRPKTEDLHDYRGYAGALRSGRFRVGDHVRVLPAGIDTRIKAIEVHQQQVEEAFAPQPVVLHLDDDIDISRGDSIVKIDAEQPFVEQDLDIHVWRTADLADVPMILVGIDPCFSCNDRAVTVRRAGRGEGQAWSWAELRRYGIDYYRSRG